MCKLMAQKEVKKAVNSKDETPVLCVETTAGNFGGYKTELLINELLPMVREFFLCYKCKNILREALSFKGKLVCSSCLVGEVGPGMKKDRIQHDARKRVSKLLVHCPFKERGCEWEGELEGITTHIRECSHMVMTCELGCQRQFVRREITKHYIQCKHRVEFCKFCEKQYKALEENKHFSNCRRYPSRCTQGCGKQITREKTSEHLVSECPETIIKCPYGEQGCDVQELKRCEMIVHIREGREKHEALTRRAVDLLAKEMKKLREVVDVNFTEIDKNISGSISRELNSYKRVFDGRMEALHKKVDITTRNGIEDTNKRLDLVAANNRKLIQSTIAPLRERQEMNEEIPLLR